MVRYVVTNPKDNTCLNNIHIDKVGSRMVGINMVSENSPTVLLFSSEGDAQSLIDKIKSKLNIKGLTIKEKRF